MVMVEHILELYYALVKKNPSKEQLKAEEEKIRNHFDIEKPERQDLVN